MREGYEQAECQFEDPELFFPVKLPGDSLKDHRIAVTVARSVCRRCPIQAKCLTENMFEPYGIYGGLTARGRKAYRIRHRIRRPVTENPWNQWGAGLDADARRRSLGVPA